MSIEICKKCGGFYATESGDMYAGRPCACGEPHTDLTRLTARLAEVERENAALKLERDELAKKRKDDQFECCVMSAVTGRENGETLTAAVDRVTRDLATARSQLAKHREALVEIKSLPPSERVEISAHGIATQALAALPADLAGKVSPEKV